MTPGGAGGSVGDVREQSAGCGAPRGPQRRQLELLGKGQEAEAALLGDRIGHFLLEGLGQAEDALPYFQGALTLSANPQRRFAVSDVMGRLGRFQEEADHLVQVLEDIDDDGMAVRALDRLAALSTEELGLKEDAQSYWLRAFALQPSLARLDSPLAAALSNTEWQAFAEMQMEEGPSPQMATALCALLARERIHLEFADAERLVEMTDEPFASLQFIETWLIQTNEWPSLAALFDRWVAVDGVADEQLKLRRARILQQYLPQSGAAAWEEILRENPDSLEAALALWALTEDRGRKDELAEQLVEQLERDHPGRVDVLRHLAQVCEEPRQARRLWRKSSSSSPPMTVR